VIAGIGWIDWALLAVLALSVVVGLWRGFLFEVMSLLGWIVAWFVAQWFAVDLAPHMPIGAPGSTLQLAVSFVGVFVAALLVWGLLAHVVQMLMRATPLSAVDRLLGAGFGLLRGAVLLLAVAFVVALTPASKSAGWRASQGALWLNTAMHGLKPVLPDTVVRRLPA
jgi:membrane protein required for colicin V production